MRITPVPKNRARRAMLATCLCTTALAFLAGCHAPAAPTAPTQTLIRVPDREAFLDATLSLLRRYDLPPDRVDRTGGVIVTQRTTSAQWFEPWRIDSQGPYQVAEASLQTISHVVTITLEPEQPAQPETAPGKGALSQAEAAALSANEDETSAMPPPTAAPGCYRLTVRADKARYSGPQRQITTASGAMGLYNENVPTMAGARGPETARADWVPLGRDGPLEELLLGKLLHVAPGVERVE